MAEPIELPALDASRRLGQTMEPSSTAAALEAERTMGIPFEVAMRQGPKVAEIQRKKIEPTSQQILQDSPALAAFMRSPAHVALTRDEVPALMQLERAVADDDVGILKNTLRMMGNTTNQLTGDFMELIAKTGKRATDTIQLAGMLLAPGVDLTPAAVATQEGLDVVQDTGKAVSEGQGYDYIPKYTLDRMMENPTPGNIAGLIFEQGGGSIPHMMAMLASLPAYSAVLAESMAQQRAANNGKADSTLEDTAAMLPVSVTIALLDKLSFSKATALFRQPAAAAASATPRGVVGEVMRSMGREAGTELVQEELQYGAESIGTDEGFDPRVAIEQGATAMIAGAGMGGALTTGSAALEAVAQRRRRGMTEELAGKFEQEKLDTTLDLIAGSAFRQTSAPKFNEYLATITDGKNLYLSPDVLPALESAGITLPFLDGKGDGEQDIQITYADVASVIDDAPTMKLLRPYMKRSIGTMAPAELEAVQAARETVGTDEIKQQIERATADKEQKRAIDQIHAEVMQGIVDTGRQGPNTARYSAELITSYVTTATDRFRRSTGQELNPKDVYARMGLGIEKMDAAPDPAGMQQTLPEVPQMEPGQKRRVRDFLETAMQRYQMEEQGQEILDELQGNSIPSKSVSDEFWQQTYPMLNDQTQKKFQRYVKSLSGMDVGSVMETNAGNVSRLAKSIEDIGEWWGGDLSAAEHLEGTERGYVAMMAWANSQRQGAPEPTPLDQIELTDEYADEDGTPVTVTQTADKALEEIDTRMDNVKKFIACVSK